MDDLITFLNIRLDERERHANSWPDGVDYDENQFVLADVAAKRQIIEEHAPKVGAPLECKTCTWNDPWEGFFSLNLPCPTLRLLALPFAGHPDYRAEWAPDPEE